MGHRTELKPGSLQRVFLPALTMITKEELVWRSEQEKSSLEIQKDVYKV